MWRGARIRSRLRWFHRGLDERYPVCCVLRFALRDRRPDRFVSGADIGGQYLDRCGSFIVCGIFHKPDVEMAPGTEWTTQGLPRWKCHECDEWSDEERLALQA